MSVIITMAATAMAIAPPFGGQCPDVLDYSSWTKSPAQKWDYRSPKLAVLGAVHSRDPSHQQFRTISAAFVEAKPTVAFFEGPDRGVRGAPEPTIRETGESGYLRFLAASANIPARSLEPSPPQQIEMLLGDFSIDKVMLFFVLRETVRLRDREGLSGQALEGAVAKLLEKIAPMEPAISKTLPFRDVAGLQSNFEHYWPARDWKTADAAWFSPTADDTRTGGVFAAAINRADSSNRDRHMVRLLREAVAKGERPFVVVGRNHVPMITPALDCLLGSL